MAVAAFVLPAALGVGGWKLHNAIVFNNSAFSTIGTYNLLYFRAAMTHYWAHGREDINATYVELASRVEERLGNDVAEIGPDRQWWHRANTPAQASAMTEVALAVFREYPLQYLLTLPVGVYRILFEAKIEMQGDNDWRAPWWVGFAWNSALLALAGNGCWYLARSRKWAEAALLLLPCAYFVFGTLLVQTSGIDTRARVMITPLLAVMAAYGALHLLNRRRAKSASPSRPADS